MRHVVLNQSFTRRCFANPLTNSNSLHTSLYLIIDDHTVELTSCDSQGYLTKEESAARALADETGNVPASAVVMLMNRLKDTDKKVVKLKFASFSTLILLIGVGAALGVIVIMAGRNTMGLIEENAVT